ncbi:hypothetical protein SCUP234_08170 [Seiridium cupressi]
MAIMEPSHLEINAGVDLEDKELSDTRTLSRAHVPPLVKPAAPTHGEQNRKGPLGLTLVHQPPQQTRPVAHLIFVLGLGGGSEHTWTHDGVLWPRDLLPGEGAFEATSIHTFGYDSDFKKSSTLNIQDFSKSLLSSTLDNPYISASQCPIILVGHSMGGLVMKRAYVLARQLPIYQGFAQLVRAMVFLATPHTGSNLAAVLSKVFRMSSGLKPYLDDLTKNSETVQSINAEFPSHSSGLSLYSFYETKPMSIGGFGEVTIVPKADAILNYPNEQSALLYGDHRGVCKFSSASDHNFSDYQLSEKHLIARDIRIEDIQNDIASYLEAHKHEVPGASPQERRFLCEGILEKANGCFLWVILVVKKLQRVDGSKARRQALDDMPPGMDHLYSKIVSSMSQREKQLSKTILTWAACAVRPLTTLELKFVLEHLAMDELDDIEAIISGYCHDLLYVDMSSLVRIRHASARKFLLRQDINCEFDTDLTISEEQGNKDLAMACLEYLNGPEMKARPLLRVLPTLQKRSIFVSYACRALHEHINKSSALDRELLTELAAFLKTNVLSWIEYVAEHGDLDTILRFSQVLKVFLRRKSRTDLLGEEVVIIDMWVTDLIKLVSKFGCQMLKYPESIFQLIPPFCPPESAIFEQFARGTTASIAVHGLSARLWDDCLSTLALSDPRPSKSGTIPRERLLSLASSEESFSIGISEERIAIFNDSYQIVDEKDGLTESPDQLSRISVYALTFSRLPDTSLLAVSYSTSKLVLFDIDTGKIVATISAVYFSRLVSSSDGRTLAASRMDGAIELDDFETLHKPYRIRPDDGAVSAFAFTTDSTRFLVIRAGGRNCRIWDPDALFRRDIGHNSVRSSSLGSGSQDGTYDQMDETSVLVTAIACDERSEIFLVGKDDFSVSAHDLKRAPCSPICSHTLHRILDGAQNRQKSEYQEFESRPTLYSPCLGNWYSAIPMQQNFALCPGVFQR